VKTKVIIAPIIGVFIALSSNALPVRGNVAKIKTVNVVRLPVIHIASTLLVVEDPATMKSRKNTIT
jgi:hypothetical protein